MLNPVLAPVGTFDLERLGRAADGGYVVDPRAVMASERLISFGMNDEWSFEADFRALNPVQVDIFDHSVDADFFFRQAYQYLLRLDRPGLFLGSARIWLSYLRFVRGAVRHHKIMVGPARMNLLDLEGVIAMLDASDQRLFLSIDIEGWEMRILDQIVENAHRLEGLAIEFHDCDLMHERIESFVEAFPLNLCHINANNNSRVGTNKVPLVLEMSFTRYAPAESRRPVLPTPLDRPNNPKLDPINIRFSDESS